MKLSVVIAGIIEYQGKVLIAKRLATAKVNPNKWEFPGGKIDFGETPQTCLKREIKEELDLDIEVKELFDANSGIKSKDNKEIHVILLCYKATSNTFDAKCVECQEFKWIDKSELPKYDITDFDLPFVDKYLQ